MAYKSPHTPMRKKLLLCLVILCVSMHSYAYFGKYGIGIFGGAEGYKRYIGQTVKYIKGGETGTLKDRIYFLDVGGDYNKEYIIKSVNEKGYIDKDIIFTLQEKGGKTKIKVFARNSASNYDEHIKDVPLLLIDELDKDKKEFLTNFSSSKIGITDIILQKTKLEEYPQIIYEITDKTDNTKYYSNAAYYPDLIKIEDFNALGKVYSDPKFRCSYKIVNVVIDEKESDYLPEYKKHYILKNSLDGSTEDISAKIAEEQIFKRAGSGQFYATLTEVEKPSNPSIRYGKTTTVKEDGITKFSYVDNYIDILLFASDDKFFLVLKNISDNSIKIVWNEAVFVDVDGSTSKIMHSGIKYSQKNEEQPASTVIKGAKVDDIIAPTDRVYYDELIKMWTHKSLYENADKTKEGQILRLMLPIQVKEVINEYVFKFDVVYKYRHPEYFVTQ